MSRCPAKMGRRSRELQAQRPELKVIFASGFAARSIDRTLEAAFLQKPYSRTDLATKLQEVLR